MKTLEEIKAALPEKTKFFFPNDYAGITRFKLESTKFRYKIRVVFTWSEGVDVLTAMHRAVSVTPEEMDELKRLFFPPEQWDECEIIPHPDNERAMIIFRPQDGVADGT